MTTNSSEKVWQMVEDALEPGETIEAVVLGDYGWHEKDCRPPPEIYGKVVSWAMAKPFLDYEWDTGYGSPKVHAFRIWTDRRIFWVTQYDGSTRLDSAPRHPKDHIPDMPGG